MLGLQTCQAAEGFLRQSAEGAQSAKQQRSPLRFREHLKGCQRVPQTLLGLGLTRSRRVPVIQGVLSCAPPQIVQKHLGRIIEARMSHRVRGPA